MISNILAVLLAFGLSLTAQPNCEFCHSEVARSFSQTGMGRSVSAPSDGATRFTHAVSGSELTVSGKTHRIKRGVYSAEYPVQLRIGSGKVGSSFAVRVGNKWFQSPISWYGQSSQFRVSPGYEQERHPDFDRPIRDECLQCHAGIQGGEVTSITCQRCHGNGEEHAAKPARHNIVNPARLGGARRDSVCEQCHLPGTVRVLNPGVSFRSFSPGQVLEEVWTTFVAGSDFRAASHAEQFAQSVCAKASRSSDLWCGSCHNPHPTEARPARSTDAVCQDCHQPHEGGRSDCARCHMPKRNVRDVVHAAYTDHRIQRPGSSATNGGELLRPWRVNPKHQDRNSALASFEWGVLNRDVSAIQEAFRKLIDLGPEDRNDPVVLSALGAIAMQKDRPREAADWLRKAASMDAGNPEAQLRLGRAEEANGRVAAALECYEAAIRIDPLYFEAYAFAAQLHRSRGNLSGYKSTLQRYLKHVPQSLAARQALAHVR